MPLLLWDWLPRLLPHTAVVSFCPCSKGSPFVFPLRREASYRPTPGMSGTSSCISPGCLAVRAVGDAGELGQPLSSPEGSCARRSSWWSPPCHLGSYLWPSEITKGTSRILRDLGTCLSVSLSWHYWILLSPATTMAFKQRSCSELSSVLWVKITKKDRNNNFPHCLAHKSNQAPQLSPLSLPTQMCGVSSAGRKQGCSRCQWWCITCRLQLKFCSGLAEPSNFPALNRDDRRTDQPEPSFFELWAPSAPPRPSLQLRSEVLMLTIAVSSKPAEPPTWQHDLLNH